MWWDTEAICLVLPASADVDTIGRLASAWNVGGRRLREVTRDSYFDRDAAIADGTLLAGERIYPFWYDHESSKWDGSLIARAISRDYAESSSNTDGYRRRRRTF